MTWIPGALSVARIVLLLPIMGLLATQEGAAARWLAFGLFLLGGLTDFLDGWAARRLGCESSIGVFLDPLADKIFASVLLIFLACRHPSWVPLWAVLLLLVRELAVQGFRSMAPCLGVVIGTGRVSKLKLVFELIAIGAVLAGLGWAAAEPVLRPAAGVALALALATGLWSLITLFRDNADLWDRAPLEMERR